MRRRPCATTDVRLEKVAQALVDDLDKTPSTLPGKLRDNTEREPVRCRRASPI